MNVDLISKHITPTHVFDIGANVGAWYREAKHAWPDARFWLIEGNPECEAMLRQVVEDVADGDRVDIAVLSDTEKEVTFYTMRDCPTATGASYYRENTAWYANPIATKRRATTLDALCWQSDFHLASSLLIKTDCQGADLDVLKGGRFMVDKARAIICEVSHVIYEYIESQKAEIGDEYHFAGKMKAVSGQQLDNDKWRPINNEEDKNGIRYYLLPCRRKTNYNEGATNTNEAVSKFMSEHGFYAAEKLEEIIHPIERERIIQSDMLYVKLEAYGG